MKRWFLLFAILIASSTFAQTVSVEFKVDMGVQTLKGLFTPGTDAVKIAGNFNGWNNGATPLTGPDADTVYSVTVPDLNVGDTLFFKFIKGADGWENDPNREYIVPAGGGTYSAFFNNDSIFAGNITDVSVSFSANMEFEIVSGRFVPGQDTLSVRGSFNGWSNVDIFSQSVGDPNIYELTTIIPTSEGETINFKYAYQGPRGTTWEGDPNKTYTFTADDISSGFAFIDRTFNDATLATLTNQSTTIKFTVNTAGAISSITGQPFTSVDNVVVAGAVSPLQWPVGGWPDSDSIRVIFLKDNGTDGDVTAGDGIWSRNVTFPQYTILRIQYKYGMNWGLVSNTGGNDNESSVGTDHFITLTPNMLNGTVINQWSVMGDHDLVDVVVGVEELNSLTPAQYELTQNYPNPFNPSTKIRFGIPEAGLVNIKVFDVLGQEVTTLVNEFRNAGYHEVDFSASKLNSGIYFYTITSGNFSATKKMMLLK